MLRKWSEMASVRNIGLSNEEKKGENEGSEAAMAIESPNTHQKSTPRDSYWFAHGGVESLSSKSAQNATKSPADAAKEAQAQKDKEERIRVFREQQEEERLKKLKDLEQQFLQAKKHREQQEEERKRRIEEARIKETERRQQVEERKRQIWEAEQERKEAILRRNMEREARIEARRNAQRNSQCFAFGSSTPRTFDLDLAAIGVGRNANAGSVLMSSVSGRRSEERELGPPRATSACSLDRKFGDDCMSRSMVSLSSSAFRGRKRTDIMPTLTRERSITPHVTPRGNHCMRAVSMTRLDQLAQPRRLYRDSRTSYASPTTTTTTIGGPRAISPSMTKSMCNLANASSAMRRVHAPASGNRRGNMSQSMMHLADSPERDGRQLTPSPTLPKSGMRSAQSMMYLAAPPRLTRAARLRAQALASSRASSAWNLSKPDSVMSGRYLSPGKDASRSPSRPQSSMSGASEISATSSSISAVNMRTRSAPRRPRPYSIAGSITDRTPIVASLKKEPESQRQPRPQEKNAQPNVVKAPRAKSVGREKSDVETPKPLSAPKKPVPPPKSKEVLARAKSHPVPTKDNLRKNVRPNATNVTKANIEKQNEEKEKTPVADIEKIQNTAEKSPVEPKSDSVFEIVNSSPVTSPVTDSEMCISSEDSRPITESDINTCTQTFTESESKVDNIESTNAPKENNQPEKVISAKEENIPSKSEPKVTSVNNVQESVEQNVEKEIPVAPVVPQKPRITSEEEARAALAEKRRLAREQAEREAELERQRQEELRRQEEERRRIEEEKQREMEQEQIRLAELHRQLEEEKLRKAIEEQRQREKEEQEKREEEARLKAEKEEQERKAREEAERQRIELEERLKKEEEERAERKRRVEQIMARTRGKSIQTPPATTPVDNTNKTLKTEEANQSKNSSESAKPNLISPEQGLTKANHILNGSPASKLENSSMSSSASNSYISNANPFQMMSENMSSSAPLPDLLNTNISANHSVKTNGHHDTSNGHVSSNVSVSNTSFILTPSRTLSANEISSETHTNGYSSHEDMSCTTSPEETTDAGLLIDIGSTQQTDVKIQPADFTKLVDIDQSSLNLSNENFLINVDNVNSNILSPEKSYTGFDDCMQKSDTSVADLLS